jgi:hypothetical protein
VVLGSENKANPSGTDCRTGLLAFRVLRIAKTNMKKQSQFLPEQIDARSYLKRTYGK